MIDQSTMGESARLDALSATLKGLRDEAIKGRADSGIETIWTEDQEYYDGIDDSNRAEKQIKPTTADGRVTRERKAKKGSRSTVFLKLTTRYVNAAAAYVADKLFRSDVSNYDIRPTPKPDLIQQSKDMSPTIGTNGQTGTVADMAKQKMDRAKESAEKAKVQIDDWLTESGINGQSRQIVMDSARIGTGVLYGPYPEMVKSNAVIESDAGVQLVIEEKMVPKSRRISAWNLYPDPSCGTDIHRGKYIFQDDEINSRRLSELKRDPSYIASAIDRVLEEGPKHAITGTSKRTRNYQKGSNEVFQIWYYHGYLSSDDLDACGYKFGDETEEESGLIGAGMESAEYGEDPESDRCDDSSAVKPERKEQYPCFVSMVNDTVIKATVSPFDSGRFPYHLMRWQYMDDHWAGVGVGRQMRTSQDGVNASVRMMHDNAGVSGAPILIFDRSKLIPADGIWSVGPHKVYYTSDEYEGINIRDAITWIITPNLQAEMMNYIQFWMKMAEEETGMPMLLQGQQGPTEHTLGEAQMLNNNGSSLLRRVTNIYDDDVTKRHIGAYYEWLLIHSDDNSMKGDFVIDAVGSSVLIERDAHSQMLMQMLGLATNPAYGADPELVYKEFLLSQRFDAEKLMLSEEKKQEMAQRQPPQAPQIAVAEIRAQSAEKIEQMRAKEQADHTAAEAHMTMAQQQFDADQNERERQSKMAIEMINAQLSSAELSSVERQVLDKIKADLAGRSMALNVQKDLSLAAHTVDLHKSRSQQVTTPPTEPAGRAQPGEAFSA